ncbi:MAG: nitrous oxide-stimulated promoter family protein [Sulfurospirillum sp.]|nr:nitrous oxide-stimulated promoter family protein [Sulfurospirillum sp.]MBL0702888.1 nitrous oxide-stimulated promoter family protein [Sulfurospirillum sp.]
MRDEKFIHDSKTVLKFIQIYCNNKHQNILKEENLLNLTYRKKELHVNLAYNLCSECKKIFLYSYQKLQACPHEEKPRCRKCAKPCYEKHEWVKVAKIMKYSGMKQGLIKLTKLFTAKTL